MRIAIDLSQIPVGKTGIGIYAVNLVREILRINSTTNGEIFYFFAQDDDGEWKELISNKKNSHLILIKSSIFRKLLFRFFFEQFLLPRKCKKLGVDLLFSFHYTMPYLTSLKRVVMIPDMTFYLFPDLHRRVKRIYFKALIPLSLRRSLHIITISESTKRDLLDRFPGLNPGKVEVIHLGVNISTALPQSKKHLDAYGLAEKSYFLFIGTLEPRKNIPKLIEAFHHYITNPEVNSNHSGSASPKNRESQQKLLQGARDPGAWEVYREHLRKEPPDRSRRRQYKLVIIGKKGWFYREIFALVKKYGLEESVIFTGYVEEEVKNSLLAHAFLFVYPSFYEGFGLPILEAMAYGIPVITGNVSSLPEVSGDAALLINPNDWHEIGDAMFKLVSDDDLYSQLSKKSLTQAKRFSWQNTAAKTLNCFKTLISDYKNQ